MIIIRQAQRIDSTIYRIGYMLYWESFRKDILKGSTVHGMVLSIFLLFNS